MGSGRIREVRRLMGGKTAAYLKVRAMAAGKDWEIVAFTDTMFVLRIERENIEFDRKRGTIRQRIKLT